MLQQEQPGVERRLRGVLEELATACSKYVNHSHNKSGGSTGRSKLDKERLRLCQREVVRITANSNVFLFIHSSSIRNNSGCLNFIIMVT